MPIVDYAMRQTHIVGDRTREWMVFPPAPEMAARNLAAVGVSHARRGFRFATKGWVNGQLLITLAGQGRVKVAGRWEECHRGDAYLTPAGQPHAYEAHLDQRWVIAWVTFGPRLEDSPLQRLEAATLVHGDPRPLHDAVRGLYREIISTGDRPLIAAWSEIILLESARLAGTLGGGNRLWKVWEAVDADPGFPWTVDDLARIACMSGEHLRRLCQRQLGRSPMQHVTELRMRQAARLLGNPDNKIESVAGQVGYNDRFGFSAAFKRHTGSSPAQYRAAQLRRNDNPPSATPEGA